MGVLLLTPGCWPHQPAWVHCCWPQAVQYFSPRSCLRSYTARIPCFSRHLLLWQFQVRGFAYNGSNTGQEFYRMFSLEISVMFSRDWVRIIGWGVAGDRSEVSYHHFLSVWAASFDTDLIIWLRRLHCWVYCPAGLPTGLSVLLFGVCHHAASVCLRDGETALPWASCVFANHVEFCRRTYLSGLPFWLT